MSSLEINVSSSPSVATPNPSPPQVIQLGSLSAAAQAQLASIQASYNGIANFTQNGIGAVSRTLSSKLADNLDVRDFGADPTGVADSTAAIQAAIVAATANGQRVKAAGTFRVSGKITVTCDADLSQAVFNVYGTPAIAVEISTGNGATYMWHSVVWLPKSIVNMTKPATGWAGQGIGVRTVNLYSCRVFVGDIKNFATGLQLTAFNGNGNGYNDYFIGHLENNGINLDLNPGDVNSWVNENEFYAGRYSHYTNEGTNVAGTRHIRLTQNTQYVNNNHWLKPSVEGNAAEYHIECGGSWNTWTQARFDSTRPCVLYTASIAGQGNNNLFIGGYQVDNIVYTYNVSNGGGVGNRTYGYAQDYVTVVGAQGNMLRNVASSNSPIQTFWESTSPPETSTPGQWTVANGAHYLYGKQSSDAYSRLKVSYGGGQIYFDNGTTPEASKTAYLGPQGPNAIGCWSVFYPGATNTYNLGSASLQWGNVYSVLGTFSGNVTVGGTFVVTGAATFTSINSLNPSATSANAGQAIGGTAKNQISLFLGNTAVSMGGAAANDYGGALRFNGSGVAWGDLAYFANANITFGGQFRFSTTSVGVNTTPNASVGVGSLYSAGRCLFGTLTDDGVNIIQASGNVAVKAIGSGLRVAEGSNAKQGVATLSGGTVVVANTSVTASSRIMLSAQDNSTTGALRVSARTAGTSFTITSSNAGDSGVIAYQIFEPA